MARDPSPSPHTTNPFGRAPRRRKPRVREERRLDALTDALRAWLGTRDWSRVGLLVGTILILSALLSLHLLPDKVSLRVGDTATQDVHALRSVRYVDEDATNAFRSAAAARIEPIYAPAHAASEADETITEAYSRLRHDQILGMRDERRASRELYEQVGVLVPREALAPILNAGAGAYHLDQAERLTRGIVHDVMDREIRDDHPADLADSRSVVAARLSASMLPRTYVPAASAIAQAVVQPNRLLDHARTLAAVQNAERSVAPIYGQVFAGDVVIRHDQVATPTTLAKLRALGLQNPRLDPAAVLCVGGLVAFMVALTCFWLGRAVPAVFASTKTLGLLSLLVILGVLGLRLGSAVLNVRLSGVPVRLRRPGVGGGDGDADRRSDQAARGDAGHGPARHPIGRHPGQRPALLGPDPAPGLGGDLRGLRHPQPERRPAGGGPALRFQRDSEPAGGSTGRRHAGGHDPGVGLGLLLRPAVRRACFRSALPLFERLFGITTHLGLLELSDPNRPLLRRFCELAPGTYTHSILVGNLAVAAAEAVGADALLCRVGALYHDLGKMNRTQFFIENQAGGDNAHDRLNPSLSALVVTAHVKDGLEIAEREKLPPVVKSFITEHHGTSLIKYFYHQQCAGEESDGTPGLEQQFRYGGPKPQSRETAILMLADGVEAASRTLSKPTLGRIEDLVSGLIDAHLADGQLGRVRPDPARLTRHPERLRPSAVGDAAQPHRIPRQNQS